MCCHVSNNIAMHWSQTKYKPTKEKGRVNEINVESTHLYCFGAAYFHVVEVTKTTTVELLMILKHCSFCHKVGTPNENFVRQTREGKQV